MKTALIALRRAAAFIHIRLLEISLHDRSTALAYVRCPETRAAIEAALRTTALALQAANARYLALPRPAHRFTWRTA